MNFEIELREDSRSSKHRLAVENPPDGRTGVEQLQISIDGKPLQADWVEVAPGAYSILIDGQSYEARVAPDSGRNGPDNWTVTIAEYEFKVEIRDPRTRRFAGRAVAQDGPLDVVAPMPGKVVRVLVAKGEEVARDQGLVVIEAMKMQNELRAPRAGRVAEIRVREGLGIESGARLLRLE